jgi:hypothetical protein
MEISTRSQRGFGTSEGREVVSAVIVEIFHAPFAGPITILVDRHLSVERIDCGVDKPLAALTSRHAPPPTRTATISSNVLGGSATGIITRGAPMPKSCSRIAGGVLVIATAGSAARGRRPHPERLAVDRGDARLHRSPATRDGASRAWRWSTLRRLAGDALGIT